MENKKLNKKYLAETRRKQELSGLIAQETKQLLGDPEKLTPELDVPAAYHEMENKKLTKKSIVHCGSHPPWLLQTHVPVEKKKKVINMIIDVSEALTYGTNPHFH